jgi:hypothetical protein
MTFILVPKRGNDLQINAWNWRPTLELLLREGLINEELYERMGAQGAGGVVDAELAGRIADAIGLTLGEMKPGERMRADLTVTDQPKATWAVTPETQPDELDTNDTYSATREWLTTFAKFCRDSGGFEVF